MFIRAPAFLLFYFYYSFFVRYNFCPAIFGSVFSSRNAFAARRRSVLVLRARPPLLFSLALHPFSFWALGHRALSH